MGFNSGFKGLILLCDIIQGVFLSKVLIIGPNTTIQFYRVSMQSFPDYKHLLQENYEEYKHIFYRC